MSNKICSKTVIAFGRKIFSYSIVVSHVLREPMANVDQTHNFGSPRWWPYPVMKMQFYTNDARY